MKRSQLGIPLLDSIVDLFNKPRIPAATCGGKFTVDRRVRVAAHKVVEQLCNIIGRVIEGLILVRVCLHDQVDVRLDRL